MDNRPNELFATAVLRVRLAGEDELYGALGVGEQFLYSLEVLKKQRRALVGSKTPRETDGQRLRVENLVGQFHLFASCPTPLGGSAKPLARVLDEPVAAMLVNLPELGIGNLVGTLPDLWIIAVLGPPGSQVTRIKGAHVVGNPRRGMHPVGDRLDRNLMRRQIGPEPLPHLA